MRVVLVTDTYHPSGSGAVVFTDTLAQQLKLREHIVAVFAPSPRGGFHLEERAGIPVYRFPSIANPFRQDSRLFLPSPIQLRAALETITPDVIHIQSSAGLATASLRIARRMHIPVVATHHFSYEFIFAYLKPIQFLNSLTSAALTNYLQRIYEKCQVLTCPTASIERELTLAGLMMPFQVISNGIDLNRYHSAQPDLQLRKELLPHTPLEMPVILSLGRLDKDKRTDLVLEAFHLLIKRGHKAHLLLVGGGNQVAQLKEYIDEHGLQADVTLHPRVRHESALQPKIFHLAQVFAICSPIDTQSLATLEAVASGLPVVAVKAGALPELAQDGVNGFTEVFGDTAAFADSLQRIILDPVLQKEMSTASMRVAAKHALPETISAFEAIYETVKKAKK